MAKKLNQKPTIKSEVIRNGNINKNKYFTLIILFFLPVLIYLQTLKFGYTHFDDDLMIQSNFSFLQDFHNIPNAFTTDQFIVKTSSFYRPLGTVSYMLDLFISGGDHTWMYHLSNILILGLIAISLYLLLLRFNLPSKLAIFGTLIYSLNPLFVSTVAHIPNRAELLLLFFTLWSFIFLIDFLQKQNWKFFFLFWISYTLALFSKETAAFLPFLFVLYYFTFISKDKRKKKQLLILFPIFASGVLWFCLRIIAINGTPTLDEAFGLSAFLINLRTIPESLTSFFFPFGVAPIPAFTIFKTLAGIAVLFFLIYVVILNKRINKRKIIFGASWFLILMIPSMLYKHPNFDYLNHRFFLPMFGILLWLLFLFPEKWISKGQIKNSWIFIAILIIFSSITLAKSRAYKDPMSFYSSAIEQNPDCEIAYNNRGVLYEKQGQIDNAIQDYSKAIELKTDDSKAYYNRGVLLEQKGMLDQALGDYENAIKFKPDYAEAYLNRGNLYGKQKLYDKAIADYTYVIKLKPDFALAYNNQGVVYGSLGKYDLEIADYSKAIEIEPRNAEAYHNRGMVYGNQGLFDKAISDFTKAIEFSPENAENYNFRGMVYKVQGLMDKACEDFNKAVELGSEEAKTNMISYCNSNK